jgi:hypothetical protein
LPSTKLKLCGSFIIKLKAEQFFSCAKLKLCGDFVFKLNAEQFVKCCIQ